MSVDLFEEEVIKRRLLIDGDGRSDISKFSLITKNYLAFVMSGSGDDAAAEGKADRTQEDLAKEVILESRTMRLVGRMQGDTVRTLQTLSVLEDSKEEFRKVQKGIKAAMDETEEYISANRHKMPNSKEQRKKRKEQQELEVLEGLLANQQGRDELEQKKDEEMKELNDLKAQEDKLAKKMKEISGKVAMFFECAGQLVRTVKDEENFQEVELGGRPAGGTSEEIKSLETTGASDKGKNVSLEPVSPGAATDFEQTCGEKMQYSLMSDSACLADISSSFSSSSKCSTSGAKDESDGKKDSKEVNVAQGKGGQANVKISTGDKQKCPLGATQSTRDDPNGGPRRRASRFASVNKGKFDRMSS